MEILFEKILIDIMIMYDENYNCMTDGWSVIWLKFKVIFYLYKIIYIYIIYIYNYIY
jgi:hypothetical protein